MVSPPFGTAGSARGAESEDGGCTDLDFRNLVDVLEGHGSGRFSPRPRRALCNAGGLLEKVRHGRRAELHREAAVRHLLHNGRDGHARLHILGAGVEVLAKLHDVDATLGEETAGATQNRSHMGCGGRGKEVMSRRRSRKVCWGGQERLTEGQAGKKRLSYLAKGWAQGGRWLG